jgi:predicted dehydrogenase
MVAYLEGEASGYDAGQVRNTGDGILINPVPVNTYLAEIEEFSSAILEKSTPSNNFTLGLRSQQLLEACYRSARTGKVVDI